MHVHTGHDKGAEPGAGASGGGLGACGGSPMRASFRPLATGDGDTKEKPATVVTKAGMTHGRHTRQTHKPTLSSQTVTGQFRSSTRGRGILGPFQ